MKEKNLILLFIINIFIKNSFQDQIIIPINPEFDNDEEENEDKKIAKDDEEGTPIVITKEYKDKKGNYIKITHFHKSKNLHGKTQGVTPIQIMKIFDDRVNSMFEDIIRQSIGIKMLLNGLSLVDDNEDDDIEDNIQRNDTFEGKSIFEELFGDEEEDGKKEKIKKRKIIKNNKKSNTTTEKNEKNGKKIEKKGKKVVKKKNVEKVGKLNVNKIKKNKKKLSKRELIFSRICKYIFYSIILFTIYVLVKKLLEVLEIIDPDNAVEIKIENDETSQLKKSSENKQN